MPPFIDSSISLWKAASVAESLAVMMQNERTVYRSCDYLHNSLSSLGIDEKDRKKMVDWCYTIIDVCQFERESVAMAMEMVDRFLSKPSKESEAVLCDRMRFQLLTMTALYVTVKINEPTVIGSDSFSRISSNVYSMKEIEAMERTLLHKLSWRISPPTCVQIAHHILVLLSSHVFLDQSTWNVILEEVEYQAENAVREYCFVTQRPSTVATAAIANAMDQVVAMNTVQDGVRCVLSVIDESFDSLEIILATKKKLHNLVYKHRSE